MTTTLFIVPIITTRGAKVMNEQTENSQEVLSLEEIEKTLSSSFYTTLAISVVAAIFLSVLLGILFLFGMGTIAVISFAIFIILIWAVFETGAHHVRRKLLPDLAAVINSNRQAWEQTEKMARSFQEVLRERESQWIAIFNEYKQSDEEIEKYINESQVFINFVAAKYPEVLNEYGKFQAEQAENTPKNGSGNEAN